MNGKGSRQRTYGKAFEDNYERIFRKNKEDGVAAPESSSKAGERATPCQPIGSEPGMSTSCLECEECTK